MSDYRPKRRRDETSDIKDYIGRFRREEPAEPPVPVWPDPTSPETTGVFRPPPVVGVAQVPAPSNRWRNLVTALVALLIATGIVVCFGVIVAVGR